ncbi:MAG TPA: DUF1893 domain-containing protein [Eubacteriales bacterium]|nr:DUF1893 domain-containing protein [Eubacteriales bacterium]HRU84179.1 DUF1893 domain-containing protein [Eubacteriales bacterium]
MKYSEIGKKLLDEGYTAAAIKDGAVNFKSFDSGLKPLLSLIDSGIDGEGAEIYDSVVGGAAAFLAAYSGASGVYGAVMSNRGVEVLSLCGIPFSFGERTDAVMSKRGGICPFEALCLNISDKDEAFRAIKSKMAEFEKGAK